MDIDALIGQLFVIGLETDSYQPGRSHLQKLMRDFRPNGFILGPSGCRSRTATRACLDELQALNAELGLPGPLIICADHRGGEGSLTASIREGLEGPAPMAQSALGAEAGAAAEEMGRIIGEDALSLGMNLNLAPYADFLERDDIEGFQFGQAIMGSDPAVNAAISRGLVRGFHQVGLGSTYAVFPGGYGSLPRDPHFYTGTMNVSLEELELRFLGALRASIAEGVDAVMLSHWAFPALDPESRPVTFSPPAIAYLRETLGFQGLIMTDAVGMRSAADLAGPGGEGDVAVRALEAGVDLLLCGTWRERRAVEEAVRSGRLPRRRVEEAVDRIVALKQRLVASPGECGTTARSDHVTAMNRWIEKSLTWYKVPVRPLDPGDPLMSISSWDSFHESVLREAPQAVTRWFPAAQYLYEKDGPSACVREQMLALKSMTRPDETILMSTYNRDELVTAGELQAAGRRVHVIHAGPPYLAPLAGDLESLLLCYAKLPGTLDLAVRASFGRADPQGVYPLRIRN